MATDQRTLNFSNASDALFRAWGSGIAAQLVACGLVQTADTGQIDWGTVTAPTAQNTMKGYEIYRFNDALQGTYPVFIKVEYGSSQFCTITYTAGMYVTVGKATNGAGTLTGTTSTRRMIGINKSPFYANTFTYNSGDSFCSGGNSRICLFANRATTGPNYSQGPVYSINQFFVVERSRDSSGAITSDYIFTWAGNSSYKGSVPTYSPTPNVPQLIPFSGTLPAQPGSTPIIQPPNTGGTGTFSEDLYVLPIYPSDVVLHPPITAAFEYFHADTAQLTPFSLTVYGQTMTYMPLGNLNFTEEIYSVYVVGGLALAMRWE